MAKMRHKDKVKLARRMRQKLAESTVAFYRTKGHPEVQLKEIHREAMNLPIFQTAAWENHKRKIIIRVDQTIANQQIAKSKREYNQGL